ncbi:MAG: hypothetical protein Q8O86_01520 [Dehalococcoidia bacterium]|nr:hypothetical protein [Dehalococcoidia bacterium]
MKDVFRAASLFPLESGDPRYVLCTEVRGDENVVKCMANRIERREGEPITQLFTGHMGSGKSTELQGLRKTLEDRGCFVALLDADLELDLNDVEYTDILLGVARGLEHCLREKKVNLDNKLLDNIAMWFAEVIYEKTDQDKLEAELSAEMKVGFATPPLLPLFAKLFARIMGQIKTSEEMKKTIRQRLDPQISHLIQSINLLIDSASAKVRKSGWKDLAILFDNLEKIPLQQKPDGTNRHEAIYLDNGRQLSALECHMVYTVPISMFFTPKATLLTGIFPSYCTLPMVKVKNKSGEDFGPGYEALGDLIARRILVEEAFSPGVVELLINSSGGSFRDLLRSIQYCCELTDILPIGRQVAERAIGKIANEFRRAIPENHYELLARVYRTKDVLRDTDHQLMLYNTSVLEYTNGDLWYDVHPAILELPRFKEALARVS